MAYSIFGRCEAKSQRSPLPGYVVWAISLLTPVLIAIVNYVMVVSDMQFVGWKFGTAEETLASSGLALGTLAMAGMSVLFGSIAAFLVSVIAPSCAGSGIPEVLGFLNGNQLPGLFSARSTMVRTVGIVFVQAAGFPVGREGPMVSIGGGIGFGVAYLLMRPYEKRCEKVRPQADQRTGEFNLSTSSRIIHEERFAQARRIGCALGGAAGIAVAFNAPIGGILYMFEELSTSSLVPKFHIFMSTVLSSFMARALLHVTSMDIHRLVIYESRPANDTGAWDWIDIPLFMVLAAILGVAAALCAKAMLRVWSFRAAMAKRLSKRQPYAKFIECVLYCALVACVFSVAPSLFGCSDQADDSHGSGGHGSSGHDASGDHRRLSSSLNYVRYICPEGQHNEVATLMLQGAEGAVKHLYSRSGHSQSIGPLLVVLFAYAPLSIGMPGLCVPMGTFIPMMLLGGIGGRIMGEAVAVMGVHFGVAVAPAGVYAVIGSAAMLSGFTHMTVGIVALLAEAINDLGLIMPLMTAVYVANWVTRLVSPHGYDEHLIIKKGVPFLDSEMPKEVEESDKLARDICYRPPREGMLSSKATIKEIKRAMRVKEANFFPVLSTGGSCLGLTTRGRLKAVLSSVKDSDLAKGEQSPRSSVRRSSICSVESLCTDTSMSSGTSSFMDLAFKGMPGSARRRARASSVYRGGDGQIGDQQVESKMRTLIKEHFSSGQYMSEVGDDEAGEDRVLPIDHIMDPAPYMIMEGMPFPHIYPLFMNITVNVACVLSGQGKFLGLITRRGLISAAFDAHHSGHTPRKDKKPEAEVKSKYEDLEAPDSPKIIGAQQAKLFLSELGDQAGAYGHGCRTPTDTDAGSSIFDTSDDCDTGEDEASLRGATPVMPGMPGARRGKRCFSKNSDASSVVSGASSGYSSSPRVWPPGEAPRKHSLVSTQSDAAMSMAEMLGPTELRAQLASAWARLAASEQKQQELRSRLRSFQGTDTPRAGYSSEEELAQAHPTPASSKNAVSVPAEQQATVRGKLPSSPNVVEAPASPTEGDVLLGEATPSAAPTAAVASTREGESTPAAVPKPREDNAVPASITWLGEEDGKPAPSTQAGEDEASMAPMATVASSSAETAAPPSSGPEAASENDSKLTSENPQVAGQNALPSPAAGSVDVGFIDFSVAEEGRSSPPLE